MNGEQSRGTEFLKSLGRAQIGQITWGLS